MGKLLHVLNFSCSRGMSNPAPGENQDWLLQGAAHVHPSDQPRVSVGSSNSWNSLMGKPKAHSRNPRVGCLCQWGGTGQGVPRCLSALGSSCKGKGLGVPFARRVFWFSLQDLACQFCWSFLCYVWVLFWCFCSEECPGFYMYVKPTFCSSPELSCLKES